MQASLAQCNNQKAAFKFFGSYRITARVGTITYSLELLASSSIHSVFHASQLKTKVVSAHHSVTAVPPSDDVLWSVPGRVLQQRTITKGTHSILQGLIK